MRSPTDLKEKLLQIEKQYPEFFSKEYFLPDGRINPASDFKKLCEDNSRKAEEKVEAKDYQFYFASCELRKFGGELLLKAMEKSSHDPDPTLIVFALHYFLAAFLMAPAANLVRQLKDLFSETRGDGRLFRENQGAYDPTPIMISIAGLSLADKKYMNPQLWKEANEALQIRNATEEKKAHSPAGPSITMFAPSSPDAAPVSSPEANLEVKTTKKRPHRGSDE